MAEQIAKYAIKFAEIEISETSGGSIIGKVKRFLELSFDLMQDDSYYYVNNGKLLLKGEKVSGNFDGVGNDYIQIWCKDSSIKFGNIIATNYKPSNINLKCYVPYDQSGYTAGNITCYPGNLWDQGNQEIKFEKDIIEGQGIKVTAGTFGLTNSNQTHQCNFNISCFSSPDINKSMSLILPRIKSGDKFITALSHTEINDEVKSVVLTKKN